MSILLDIIDTLHITVFSNYKVSFTFVKSPLKGEMIAHNILTHIIDKKTLLLLSGGKTPEALYAQFAKEKNLLPGAVGVVDERYGEPFHAVSNENMFRSTGFLSYLQKNNIPFHPMLQEDLDLESAALQYDETLRYLLNWFPKSVAILGIGVDGHFASIAPDRPDFHNPMFDSDHAHRFVDCFTDPVGMSSEGSPEPPHGFGSRITLTFKALEQVDFLLVMAFGKKKKKAVQQMLTEGPLAECPARFFTRPEISLKTLFITDQKV